MDDRIIYTPIEIEYIYRQINKLTKTNLCNCYFFLIKTDNARPKSDKYICTLLGSDNEKDILKVNIFFSLNQMDIIDGLQVGNIIRVQRLSVTVPPVIGDDQVAKSCLAKLDFDHNNTSFTVFSSDRNSGYQPISSSTLQYSLTKKDKDTIDKMRSEWSNRGLRTIWEKYFKEKRVPSHSCTPIENLKANQFFSIVAKVIDKQISISSTKKATLTLWDGTGEDVAFGGNNNNNNNNNNNDSALLGNSIQCYTWTEDLIRQCEDSINIGSWLYISGAKSNIYQEVLEIKLFKSASIHILPEDSPQVISVLKNYKERLRSYYGNSLVDGIQGIGDDIDNNDNNDQQQKRQRLNQDGDDDDDDDDIQDETNYSQPTKTTETPYPHIPITTIETIKSIEQQVPNKFKIHVSLVQHIPLNILDFTRVLCQNEQCGKTSVYRDEDINQDLVTCSHCGSLQIEYIFLFKFIVKDQTGELQVLFSNDNANSFLNLLPTNLYIDKKSLGEIEGKMAFLKKPRVSFDLCIQSYYENEKERIPENIKYQAFDTKLLVKSLLKK